MKRRLKKYEGRLPEKLVRCLGCQNMIDLGFCGCGESIESHTMGSGHSPVPMGCTCGYEKPEADWSLAPSEEDYLQKLRGFVHWPMEAYLSPAALAHVEIALNDYISDPPDSFRLASAEVRHELTGLGSLIRSFLQHVVDERRQPPGTGGLDNVDAPDHRGTRQAHSKRRTRQG